MTKLVVFISGKMRSGKNELANIIMDELKTTHSVSYDFFANDLKHRAKQDFSKLVEAMNSIISDLPDGETKDIVTRHFFTEPDHWFEDKNTLTRILLQLYGTEIFRDRVSYSYWTDLMVSKLERCPDDIVFITDGRFPNEITALENKDWKLLKIRVERPIERDALVESHASETMLDDYSDWDLVIHNDSTIEEFRSKKDLVIDQIFQSIR
jgi:uridine kinase